MAAISVLIVLSGFGTSLLLSIMLAVGYGKHKPMEETQPNLASDIESADNVSAAEAETDDDRKTEAIVTVSLAQMKDWAETLSGPPSNLTQNLTRQLDPVRPFATAEKIAADEEKITYLGSTRDYHYFTYPKPYYRVSRQEWPTLESEFGDIIDDPKDLPHCTLWLNNEMTLDVAHPHRAPSFPVGKDFFNSIEMSPSTKPGQLKITANFPHQLPARDRWSPSEYLSGCQLLHPDMPPSEISIKADGKDRLIEFMIGEKWLGESRLVLYYLPWAVPADANRFVFSLSEFRDEPREKTGGISYYWHGMLHRQTSLPIHKTTKIVPDAAPEPTADPEAPDPTPPPPEDLQ